MTALLIIGGVVAVAAILWVVGSDLVGVRRAIVCQRAVRADPARWYDELTDDSRPARLGAATPVVVSVVGRTLTNRGNLPWAVFGFDDEYVVLTELRPPGRRGLVLTKADRPIFKLVRPRFGLTRIDLPARRLRLLPNTSAAGVANEMRARGWLFEPPGSTSAG